MIAPGSIVLCRQTGAAAMVVERREAGGWRVVCKGIDDEGRSVYASRVAGEGDLVLVAPAPTFAVGAMVMHNGLEHTVIDSDGDTVTLSVPGTSRPLRGGGHLHIAAGNNITLSKADLVLEDLR